MTREEMLKRLEDGGDPLEISISKWEDIWLGVSAGSGGNNCALCHLFMGRSCKYCPIYRYTGETICYNTPFEEFIEHRLSCGICSSVCVCKMGKILALKEVDFLKKLAKW